MLLKPIILLFSCSSFLFNSNYSDVIVLTDSGQVLSSPASQDSTMRMASINRILLDIQNGIMNGNVSAFSSYIAPQIYLNLLNTDEGYFSSNQSSFILQHFFSSVRMLTFRFTTVHTEGLNTYATGGGTFMRKGSPEIVQIYVAMKYRDGDWIMTQFNIY
jgi:hypothetical protein